MVVCFLPQSAPGLKGSRRSGRLENTLRVECPIVDFRALHSLRTLVTLGGIIQNILGGDKVQLHPSLLHSAPRVGAPPAAPVLTVVSVCARLLCGFTLGSVRILSDRESTAGVAAPPAFKVSDFFYLSLDLAVLPLYLFSRDGNPHTSQRAVAGHHAGGSRGGPFSAPVLRFTPSQMLGELRESEESGCCSQAACFPLGPRPSFASRQPQETRNHSHHGKLVFVGNSRGDGLGGNGQIPRYPKL